MLLRGHALISSDIGKSRYAIGAASFLLLLLIGIADYSTGVEIGVSIFYLIPIMICAIFLGRIGAIAAAFAAASLWTISAADAAYSSAYILYWNSFARLLIFLVVGVIMSRLITSIRDEKRQKHELRRLISEKSKLLGIAAHDLRNPIGIIGMYSSHMLKKDSKNLSASQKKLISSIDETSSFMQKLVEDMLDFSQAGSDAMTIDRSGCNYVAFVREIVRLNQVFAKKKRIRIDFLAQDKAIDMMIDRNKIRQVLNNIMINALNYSPQDSHVIVSIRDIEDEVVTSIRDHGQGIAPEEMSHIFRPFHRGKQKTTAGEKSTGLGLTIAKNIVEKHGGRIWVESAPGEGADFRFTLPKIPPPA